MPVGSLIRRIGNEVLDLVYPMSLYCISCGKMIDESRTYRLCNDCMEAMNWITDRHCLKCGKPLADNDPGGTCFACKGLETAGRPHAFDKGYACAGYGTCERSVIFAFKYGSRSDIGVTLAEIMYDRLAAEHGADRLPSMYDMVMPVPIYKDKKKKRGFDHADIMAKGLAKRAGIRYEPGTVIRTRETLPMKGLSPGERRANIKGAFSIREREKESLRGSRVLLVDDIFTTGATIDEIAAVLKEAGASRVDFLAYAGGRDMISG